MCKKVSFLPQSASDDKFVLKEIPFVHPLQALLKWTHMFKISMHEVVCFAAASSKDKVMESDNYLFFGILIKCESYGQSYGERENQ